ncbi:MAG: GspE/PulE family protein [bacterium]
MDLVALLEERGVIDRAQSLAVHAELLKPGTNAEAVLLQAGVALKDILRVKGDYYGVPTRELGRTAIPFEILNYVPEESARHYRFIPIGIADGVLEIGITDPDNLEGRDALTFISAKVGMPYKVFLISESDFTSLLVQYKGLSGEVGKALSELSMETASSDAKTEANKKSILSEEEQVTDTAAGATAGDAPITKIVATMLRHAFEQRASDIHVEPLADKSRVRFRIDGKLTTNITLPPGVHGSVIARIKVLSNVRLDEKRKPQDGRFSARIADIKVDFRVSTFPTYFGEKVVMRILGSTAKELRLDDLGFAEHDLLRIRAAIKKPYGLILVSGPTGSGKSTSLYAILNEIDRESQNVLSLEDPIEYTIPGVSQSQVRPEIGYTFANGLRTTLRQDPNVIMVGEIRDSETASLAVQAALTGHLVLSTIHTNNAVGIVPRLLDMGVESYLIPPVLILGMAQRLVRTLCPGSGAKVTVEGSIKEMLDNEFKDLPAEYQRYVPALTEVYRIKPTPECPSGLKGRTAVVEMFEMNAELERAILERKPEDEINAIVRKGGMFTMKEDAIIKSVQGVVPFEEVNMVGGQFTPDEVPTIEVPVLPMELTENGTEAAAGVALEENTTGGEIEI